MLIANDRVIHPPTTEDLQSLTVTGKGIIIHATLDRERFAVVASEPTDGGKDLDLTLYQIVGDRWIVRPWPTVTEAILSAGASELT